MQRWQIATRHQRKEKISQSETEPWCVGMDMFPGKSHQPVFSPWLCEHPCEPIIFTFQHLSPSAPKHACCVWGTTFHFLSSQSLCLQSKRTHIDTQVNRMTDFLWSFCFLNGICQGGRHIFSPWNSYIDWRWYPFCLEEFKSFSPVYIQFCQLCFRFPGSIHSGALFILMSANGSAFDRSEINASN